MTNYKILTSVSAMAIAVFLAAAVPQSAFAANECDPEVAGADTVTCGDPLYASGIDYTNSDGLTINITDPAAMIGPAPIFGVSLDSSVANTNDLVINAIFDTISSTNSSIRINSRGTAGNASVTMTDGNIMNTGAAGAGITIFLAATNTGDGTVLMQNGTISSAINGMNVQNNGVGDAIVTMENGAITVNGDSGGGLYAWAQNFTGSGTAHVTMNDGTITTTGEDARGLLARNSGLGDAFITVTGGTINTSGDQAYGMWIFQTSASTSGTSRISASNNEVHTNNNDAHGIYLQTSTDGVAEILTDNTVLTTNGILAHGIYGHVFNNTSTGSISVSVTGGSVETSGATSHAVAGEHIGPGGNATVLLTGGGTASTATDSSHAVYSFINNVNSAGLASATLNNGTVTTTGNNAFGVYSQNIGSGDAQATLTAGNISATGTSAHGVSSLNSGLGDAVALVTDGSITLTGDDSRGVWSRVTNAASTAVSSATMNGGSINIEEQSYGMISDNFGLGDANITMTGGTITGTNLLGFAQGLLAANSNASATGDVNVTMTGGAISLTGEATGITATNAGTGDTIITMNGGSITGNGFIWGIYGESNNDGDLRLNLGGGTISALGDDSYGAYLSSPDGSIFVDMTAGSVTAGGDRADGIVVNVADATNTYDIAISGGSITGGGAGAAAIHTVHGGSGTVDIGSGGTINAGASGIAIRDGDDNYDGTDETGGATTITSAGTINGNVILGLGADAFTVSGTLDGTVYGGDVLATAGDGDDIFTLDGGTWNGISFFGSDGSDTVALTNTATANMGAAATIDSEDVTIDATSALRGTGGGAGIYDFSSANVLNNGLVSFFDGASGDFITAGSWAGTGFVELDGDFSGAISFDRLLITGDMTGTATIRMADAGGAPLETGSTNIDGYSIVQVGGNSTANAFALEGGYVAVGPYRYELFAFDSASSDPGELDPGMPAGDFWDYRLQSVMSSGGGGTPVPQIGGYQALPTGTSFTNWAMMENLHRRTDRIRREKIWDRTAAGQFLVAPFTLGFGSEHAPWAAAPNGEMFFGTFGQISETNGDDGPDTEQDMAYIQGGAAVLIDNIDRRGGTLLVGPAFSYGKSSLEIKDSGAKVDTQGPAYALTALYDVGNGAYIDVIAQATTLTADISTPARGQVAEIDGWGAGLSIEGGQSFSLSKSLTLEPQAQLAWQRIRFDKFTDTDNVEVNLNTGDSLQGRVGFQMEKILSYGTEEEQRFVVPYLTADLVHEFLDSDGIRAGGVMFDTDTTGTQAKIGAGLHAQISEAWEFHTHTAYGQSLTDGSPESLTARIDFKLKW